MDVPSTNTPSHRPIGGNITYQPTPFRVNLLSQGNLSYGTVEFFPTTPQFAISQNANWSESEQGGVKWTREQKIRVEVSAEYRDTSAFDRARVCMIGGEIMEGRTVPTSTTGGNTTGDSTPKQIGVMVWVSSTVSHRHRF